MCRRNHFDKSIVLLLLCIVFIYAKSVINEKVGSLQKDDKKKTFIEGKGVLLPCNVTESPEIKVWWTKNESHSTFHQDGIVLRFNVVSRLDAGTYLCHAQNLSTDTNATVVDNVILNVQYPGEVKQFFISKTGLVENDTTTIHGVVEGNPDPTYTVYNNDTGDGWISSGLAGTFTLIIQVRCGDTGNFMISGHNKLNKKNFTKSEFVSVFCAPKGNAYKYNTRTVYAALGTNTSLRMDSVGYPYPQFLWRHNNVNINYRSTQLTPQVSALYFDEVSISDFGNYTLTMHNEYGQYTTIYQLIGQGPPGKPTNLQVLELKDHSVRLGWSTGYDYGLQETVHIKRWIGNEYVDITQANVQTKSTGFQHVEKEVYNLNSSTSYRIILVSENTYGLSQQSEEIIFVTKEQRRKHLSHSASGDLSIIIPVSIVGALALTAVVFAIVHLHCKTKKGSSDSASERKRIIN